MILYKHKKAEIWILRVGYKVIKYDVRRNTIQVSSSLWSGEDDEVTKKLHIKYDYIYNKNHHIYTETDRIMEVMPHALKAALITHEV